MGVTLHYKGTLKSVTLVDEITNELIDISEARDWDYKIIKSKKDSTVSSGLKLNGIMTGPKGCEPISMTFLTDGRLVSPMLSVFPEDDIKRFLEDDDYYAFTKTQFGGTETHIEIVKLLKYLSTKYFDTWDCKDDSEYYQTGDKEKLEETMGFIDNAMTALDDAFNEHGDSLNKDNPQEMIDFISSVLGVEDIEVKIVNATIDEDGIEIIDENAALEELLDDASKANDDSDEEDDIDLSDLLDMDGLES
ncbi:MAG: hypothetical protein ACI86M_001369 [Saprospiraceae bacterium]|jgi:hypothetical protein